MARITVEDCVTKVDRFTLVLLAAQRVREIESGAVLMIPRGRNKNPVLALREIANDALDLKRVEESFVKTFAKNPIEEDIVDDVIHAEVMQELAEPSSDETLARSLEDADLEEPEPLDEDADDLAEA